MSQFVHIYIDALYTNTKYCGCIEIKYLLEKFIKDVKLSYHRTDVIKRPLTLKDKSIIAEYKLMLKSS